jgi:hypothetical protein
VVAWKNPHHELRDRKLRTIFLSLEKHLSRGGFSGPYTWTPSLAAYEAGGDGIVEMTYGNNAIRRGRYWSNGAEVWFEAQVVLLNTDSWDAPANGGGYIGGPTFLSVPLPRSSEHDPLIGFDEGPSVPTVNALLGVAEALEGTGDAYGGNLSTPKYNPDDSGWDAEFRNWCWAGDHYGGSLWTWAFYPAPLVPTRDAAITWSGRYFTD